MAGVGLREVARERLPSQKTSSVITWPQVQMSQFSRGHPNIQGKETKTNMKVILSEGLGSSLNHNLTKISKRSVEPWSEHTTFSSDFLYPIDLP